MKCTPARQDPGWEEMFGDINFILKITIKIEDVLACMNPDTEDVETFRLLY